MCINYPSVLYKKRISELFLTMKFTIISLTIVCLQASSNGGTPEHAKGEAPGKMKRTISAEKNNGYRLTYYETSVPPARQVIHFTGINQQQITGRVLSESGEPLAGVSVIVKGTKTGTTTDANGNFSLTAPDDAILVFSAVGYENEEAGISGKSTLNISLRLSNKVLEPVIAIGYGTQRKKDLTGASISIKGSEIANLPALSATQAIQGKAAGVQIINSGAPGSAPNVRIRGTGSILGGVDPLYIVDGIITDDIRNINSADILTIDILKDASSTAIYGARAANGVILITTKAGNKSNKLSISYNGFAGVRILNHKVEMAGPNLFTVYSNEAANAPAILASDITGSSDWYSTITRPAIFQNHNLSLSGGLNKYRYFISGGYLNENGILLDNNYQRFTVRLNHEFAINTKFKVGNNLAFSHYISENKPYNLFSQAYIAAPLFNAKNPDGSFGNTDKSDVGNPLATLKTTNNRSYGNRATGTLWAEYQVIKGLTFKSSFGIDAEQNNGWDYTPVYNTYYANGGIAGQKNEKSDLNFSRDSIYHWTWDNFFTYEIKLGAAHNLKLTAGHTSERRNGWSNNSSIANGNVPDDEKQWVLNSTDTAGGQQNTRTPIGNYYKRESYFIRANYAFMDKFLLNATFRRDGSSNFPASRHWGNFPAVGLGWIVTKEKFMQHQTLFDFLKVRASYGLVGNDVAPANQFSLSPSEFLYAYFGTNRVNGATITSIKDPNLQWEVVKEFDFGIEFSALDKKITGEVDYYHKNATKALYTIPLPNLGFGDNFITNAANVLNQGVELSLGWNNTINKNTRYSVKGNITFNKNSVESIGIGQAIPDGDLANGKTATLTAVGQPIGSFWVYKTDGIFQTAADVAGYPHLANTMPGDFRLLDMNKDGVIDEKDKYFAGSYQPKIYYGLNATLNWKQFDFGMDIFGNAGNKVYNAKKGVRYGGNYNVEYDVAINRWTPGSGINDIPRAFNGTTTVSDYFVESGSFIRINNLTAGYTFKFRSEHAPFQNLRVFANAQNPVLFTKYTGFAPELPGSPTASGIELNAYPVSASYMIGVNVQLK
jgi:TonB-dependent starch-binding outer membrane protein SusC